MLNNRHMLFPTDRRSTRNQCSRRSRTAMQPVCEALEGRRLLSVSTTAPPQMTINAPVIVVNPPRLHPPVPVHPFGVVVLHPPNPCAAGARAR